MKVPKISLVAALSVFLLLSCLLGNVAGLAWRQHPGRYRVVRGNRLIEARQLDGEPDDGYGPPPPYYTGEPVVPVDTTSDASSKEVTATDIETGSSRATMTSEPLASSGNYTFSRGISSLPVSSVVDTNTAMPSAASSAKAGSTSSSEAPTAVGTTAPASSRVTETSGDDILTTADGQLSATWSNSTSSTGTHSSATVESGTSIVTDSTWSDVQTKSLSEVIVSTSFSENSGVTTLTMTTTKVLNTTMTPTNMVESIELVPSSTTYPAPINSTSSPDTSSGLTSEVPSLTVPVSLGQTTTSVSEENPSFSSLASASFRTITSESAITEVSVSESMQKTSLVTSGVLNGTTVVTTTTYLTTTLDAVTTSDRLSNSSDGSSAVTSGDLSGAGNGEVSSTIVSITAASPGNFTNAGSSLTTLVSSTTILSTFSTSTSTLSGSLMGSESDVSTVPIQTSSDTLVASSALPANATSNAVASSVTVTTNSENSIITIIPGGIPPTGNATGMVSSSASTDYSTSSLSPFNTSATLGSVSSFQETGSFLDWSTSTIVESQTSHTTLGLPPVSFTSFSFSIITTPMTPPDVMTTSTSSLSQNVTVIMSTWTSTITTSLGPTGLTSSVEPTAAHSSSGYNFSKTLGSETSSVGSWSTSVSNLSDISTSIITRQPTNLPFPINTTMDWQSMTSSVPLTQSAETVGSWGRRTTLTAASSGFNNTAPYVNSTSTIVSTTYSPTSFDVISSKMAFTTYPSWNTTNTVQGPANSTLRTTTFHAPTESSMSGATPSLNGTAVITSPSPTSEHTELVTISGSVSTQTFTNIPVSIITPTSAIFWSSSAVSMSLNNTPPFPFPSNTTVAGTGVPLPPTGTGAHPTIVSTPGKFSTPYRTSTSTTGPKYHTSNTTQHGTVSGSSASSVGTDTPPFPSSNSTTTAAVTFSSIPSWTPDPEPWTTWSTWSLSGKSNPVTTNGLPRVTFGNLSSEAPVSTTYTRTTTLSLTTTLAEPTASRSSVGNLSSKVSYSTSYTRTTTLFLTTTLAEPSTSQRRFQNLTSDSSSSVSYTSTTTLFLTTTLRGGSTSRVSDAAITSTTSPWMNTTLAPAHSSETTPYWSEVSGTFLTTGSAKGISTSAGSSASTPFPMINSTLSQATSSAVSTLTTRYTSDGSAGVTTPCETPSTTSSTCTDSLYHPTHVLSSSVGSVSTDCLTATGGTASSWSYSPVPTVTGRTTTACNTTGPMSSYSTAHWSNMTNTFGVKDTETNTRVSLTTFKTVTTVQAEMSGSVWDDYPTPTDKVAPSEVLPSDLNFPWGNDSPIHRHQNVSDLDISVDDGEVSKRGDWQLRWENVKDKLKGLWHGQTSESED